MMTTEFIDSVAFRFLCRVLSKLGIKAAKRPIAGILFMEDLVVNMKSVTYDMKDLKPWP